MVYVLGIDGGGTHSRLIGMDQQGREIARAQGASTNIESNPLGTVQRHMAQLVSAFFDQTGLRSMQCAGLCIGTAGVDTASSLYKVENALRALEYPFPVQVTNDAVIALYAATRGAPGLMLVSGTGSIGYGIGANGRQWRVGGFGYLVGDEGSAYWLAREAVAAALKAFDHSGPPTALGQALCAQAGLDGMEEMVDFVYQKNKSDLARLAAAVTLAHQQGDAVAAGIMRRACAALENIVVTLVNELALHHTACPLLLGGGLLLNNPWLRDCVSAKIAARYPLLAPQPLQKEAVWGAAYMAARQAGWDVGAF